MAQELTRHAGRAVQPERKPHSPIRTVSLLVAALVLALTLAACNSGQQQPQPDPGPPASMTAPETLRGVTTASVEVENEGNWRLQVQGSTLEPQPELGIYQAHLDPARVSLSRSTGSGPTAVELTIDHAGLNHVYEYVFGLRLEAGGKPDTHRMVFTFPYVYGRVTPGVGGAALNGEPGVAPEVVVITPQRAAQPRTEATTDATGFATGSLPNAHVYPLATAPVNAGSNGVAPGEIALEPGDDTVTLVVGLQPADRGLATAGLPGAPAAAAVQAFSATAARIPGAATQAHFDEAGLVLLEVPADEVAAAVERLQGTAGVEYVELPKPLYPFQVDDPHRVSQWHLNHIEVEPVWADATGEGVTIAVLDRGFHPRHPDLADNIVGEFNVRTGSNSVETTGEVCGTHGTHVAGIAAAVTNNGIGVAGVARNAGLYLVELGDTESTGCGMNSTRLIAGIQHIVNGNRADVINLSLGSADDLGTGVVNALQAARNAGIIVIGSAGNTDDGTGAYTFNPVSYPAAYEQVWAVGATDRTDRRAYYSHIGPELFITAPGGSRFGVGGTSDMILSTDYRNGAHDYGWMEGTSMAAPMVAAVVALLMDAEPGASNAQIRQAIIDGATDLGTLGFDLQYGHGLINAHAAYQALTGGAEPPPPPTTTVMRLSFPNHPEFPVTFLQADGSFIVANAPNEPFLIVVETDDNEDGQYGTAGDRRGEATLPVQFDRENQVTISLQEQ